MQCLNNKLFSRVAKKLSSDQVCHKPGCTAAEDGQMLEFFSFRNKRDCTINVVKPKALISCAVTVQLFCVFVFAYGKSREDSRVSHDAAQIQYILGQSSTRTVGIASNFQEK